jgi:hypothetical protein
MSVVARRRLAARAIRLDRSLEALPLFRLSDSADDGMISFAEAGDGPGRWRVIPGPGDRLPGTFDQDVYVEVVRRYQEDGEPADGTIAFTLHAFLRAMGRRVDGRTYEQLRGALGRLERTTLESHGMYRTRSGAEDVRFTVLTSVAVERRRTLDREQLPLFPSLASGEPGVARVTLASAIRENLSADHVVTLSAASYWSLDSPVARRLYRRATIPIAPAARPAAGPRHAGGTGHPSQRCHPAATARVVCGLRDRVAAGVSATTSLAAPPSQPFARRC